MTTILRYNRVFAAYAYFNQFIRPNDYIINVCKYKRCQLSNAENDRRQEYYRMVNNDQFRDSNSFRITLLHTFSTVHKNPMSSFNMFLTGEYSE